MMLAKHGRHLHFLTILVLLLGNGLDRIAEARQAAVGKDSAAQQTPPQQTPPKHTVTGQVAVLVIHSADNTRLAVVVTGKEGQKTIEFRMDRHSKATTSGLKKGATVVVVYHDYKKVHLVSLVRVLPLPTAPTPVEQSTTAPPPAPSGQTSPALKQNLATPLSTKQGAVAENIPPGVFEKDYRPSATTSSGLGGLLGGQAAGSAAGSASSTTASGQAATSGNAGAAAAASASASSGTSANERGIKTVTGKVISWGAEFLLLDAKDNKTDAHAVLQVFLTKDTEFEKEVTLDDDVVVTYAKRRGENIAISVNMVHPSTGVDR
jgi:hypothetical protein